MTHWDIGIWIRLHWFELATLALLSANLWFVFGVFSVLRAINQALVLLGRVDRTRGESTPEGPPAVLFMSHPLLISIALAGLSWAFLVVIVVVIWAVL